MTLAIGVDIGGTKVAAGVVDADGNVLTRARRRTPSHDPEHIVDVVVEIVRQLRTEHDAGPVGIGAAGYIDVERAHVMFAPNLPGWRNTPLREQVSERLGSDVVVENDANAAAWGEYRFGAGEQEPDLVCLTVGTGIGGGIVVDGRLHRGRFGVAAEPGHMRVVPGGRACGCGNLGCWEQYASGSALVRAAREVATERKDDGRRLVQLAGSVDNIDGPTVTMAASEGDAAAIDCFDEIGRWLGQGMADLAAVLDPGRFVIGGGVADAGELLLRPARETFGNSLSGRGYRPAAEIVAARLGPDAGLIGAADLARVS
jgi:glucokinase